MKRWIFIFVCALVFFLAAGAPPSTIVTKSGSSLELSLPSPELSEEALKKDIIEELRKVQELARDNKTRNSLDILLEKMSKLVSLQKAGEKKSALELKYDIDKELVYLIEAIAKAGTEKPEVITELKNIRQKVLKLLEMEKAAPSPPLASEEELKKDIIKELQEAQKLAKELAIDKKIPGEIGRIIEKTKKLIELQKKGAAEEALKLKYDIASELKGVIIAIPPPPPEIPPPPPEIEKSRRIVALFGIMEKVLEKVEKLIAIEKPPPPPRPVFTYSVKFLWGKAVSEKQGVKPANYATAINIHNPTGDVITLFKKAVVAHPQYERPRVKPLWSKFTLIPNDAIEIDGIDICKLLGIPFPPPSFIKGFVVIQSSVALDVVAVYTASTETGLTLDVEYVKPSAYEEPHKPSGIALSPPTATNPVCTIHTVTAFVFCKDERPVVGIPVIFHVSGAHTLTSPPITTDSAGRATWSYHGINPGTDTIIAKEQVTGLTATATKIWKKEEIHKPTKIVLSPEKAENPVGTTHTVTALVTCADGRPVVGASVYFKVTGANPQDGKMSTDSGGKASFVFAGKREGTDTIIASVDGLTATAIKYWYIKR